MKRFIPVIVLLLCSIISSAQNVVQAEYFIDIDLGVGSNTAVTLANPQPDGTYNLNINLSGVSAGYHKLYIRTKDADGKWSFTSRRNIEVVAPNTIKNVVSGEYFFNIDSGYNAAYVFTIGQQDSVILQNFTAATNNLSAGYHKLYMRTKDSNGAWSQTSRSNVEIFKNSVSLIAGAEYFFITDSGIGNASPVRFNLPASDGSFSFKIPVSNIPVGSNTLAIRAKDSVNNNYSITQWQADSVVTSVKTGLWSDINTWSNKKIPGPGTIVLIYHNVIVDIDAFCRSLTPYGINVSATVNSGKTLNITGQ